MGLKVPGELAYEWKLFLDDLKSKSFPLARFDGLFASSSKTIESKRCRWLGWDEQKKQTIQTQLDFTDQLKAAVEASAFTGNDEAIADWLTYQQLARNYARRGELLEAFSAYRGILVSALAGFFKGVRFPNDIDYLARLVHTSTEVRICCDAVDYGSFRDFKAHRRLVNALIEKGDQAHVLLIHRAQPLSGANMFNYEVARARDFPAFRECLVNFLSNVYVPLEMNGHAAAWAEIEAIPNDDDAKHRWYPDTGEPMKCLRTMQDRYQQTVRTELEAAHVEIMVSRPTEYDVADANQSFYWIGSRANNDRQGITIRTSPGQDGTSAWMGDDDEVLRWWGWIEGELKKLRPAS